MIRYFFILVLFCYSAQLLQAQSLSQKEINYLIKNTSEIEFNDTSKQWYNLNKKLNENPLVLLGECNHGSKEIFLIKNSLIKNLNENLKYDVLLFESGLAEMINFYDYDAIPFKELKTAWRTQAFKDLLEYAKNNNMEVAGFDILVTGHVFQKRLNKIKPKGNLNIELEYTNLITSLADKNAITDPISVKVFQLIDLYNSYLPLVNNKHATKIELLTYRGISNRIACLKYMLEYKKDKIFSKQLAARDSLMASNIDWLMKEIYPNRKAIVYTHNIHASKYNKNEEMMGEWLQKSGQNKIYSIGMFAGSGTYSDYTGKIKTISAIEKNSALIDLKSIINTSGYEYSYLRMPKKSSSNTNWLFHKVLVNDTFIDMKRSNKMNLSKHFDAVIFVKKVSIPAFID